MADGITLDTPGTPSSIVLKTDDDGTFHWQVVKIAFGADNTRTEVGSTASNPLPVALSDLDNAVLDQIEVNTSYGDSVGGGTEAAALRVTIANDSTGLVSIDDNGGSITIDNADITTIAGAVSGSEMQVDVVASLPAGTNAIGKLSANSGVDIGDVDVLSVIPGTGATNLGKAIDTAAGATDTGIASLAVRDDSLTTLTPVDGDYVPLRVNSTGALHVTGGGGGTEYTEDVATANPIVGSATLVERDDALTTVTPAEGDWIGLRGSAEGALWTQDFNSDAMLTSLELIDNAVSGAGFNITQMNGAAVPIGAGTEAAAVRVTVATDSTGVLSVDDNGGSLTVDNAGLTELAAAINANELDVNIASSNATITVDLGANNDVTVTGGNAHDGTTLGNPVLAGARATNSIEGLTQVANADLTHLQADLNGVLLTRPYTTAEEILSERISNTNGTSTNFSTFAAGGAGVHNYVTTASVWNSSATDGYVDLRDGSAGSILWTLPAPTAGGSITQFPVPLKGAANTALAYDVSGALSTVYVSVSGYQAQG